MPSLVASQSGMNVFDYRNPSHNYNGITNDMAYNHEDTFDREDTLRREEDDRFRRGFRNGGNAYDRFDHLGERDRGGPGNLGGGEPGFLLDHLATFSAGTRNGMLHAMDGVNKLRHMENTTGIWTMRCVLVVERGFLVIYDYTNGEELERFPIQSVIDPAAVFKNDHREHYNSLIVFTIMDDPKKKATPADMHIFQTCGGAHPQLIVDEILAAQSGQPRIRGNGASKIPPPPMGPAPDPPNGVYNFHHMRDYLDQDQRVNQFGASARVPNQSILARVSSIREKEDIDGGSTEIMERDVQLLNHCFDDIEKFVARLQQAAEAFKELERRKKERNAKNKKKQYGGEGMLNARAKPPIGRDFIDIFQKFKLSFNLLAKLKAHIHDPNAPELVHFLFTPLSLIYEASRDPFHGSQNLGDQAVAPVLTVEGKLLLQNCLTSKELELWHALGKHWTTSRAEWQGPIPPYAPEFFDGWKPAGSVIDDTASRAASVHHVPTLPLSEALRQPTLTDHPISYRSEHTLPPARPTPFPDEDRPPMSDRFNGNLGNINHAFTSNGPSMPLSNYSNQNGDTDRGSRFPIMSRQSENNQYLKDLLRTEDALIYEAAHDRKGKNSKELDVQRGDVFHVLDNSKNWWKLRNYKGMVGFAPYTILKPVRNEDDLEDQIGGTNSRNISSARAEMPSSLVSVANPVYGDIPAAGRNQERQSWNNTRPRQRTPSPLRSGRSIRQEVESHSPTFGSLSLRGHSSRNSWVDAAASLDINQIPQQDIEMRKTVVMNRERNRESGEMKAAHGVSYRNNNGNTPPAPAQQQQPQQQPQQQQNQPQHGQHQQQPPPLPQAQQQQQQQQQQQTGPQPQVRMVTRMVLDYDSSPYDIASWLRYKGFKPSTREMFSGYSGADMFGLHLEDLQDVLPHEDAIRLDGLLRLQKNASGYRTNSAKELNAILQRRKQLVSGSDWEVGGSEETVTEFREDRRQSQELPQQQQHNHHQQNAFQVAQLREQKEEEIADRRRSSILKQPKAEVAPDYRIVTNESDEEGKENFKDLLVRQRNMLRQSQSDLHYY